MTSWRDSASEASQADLDGLLNAAIEMASRLLISGRGFAPFSVTTSTDSEDVVGMVQTGGDAPASESPTLVEQLVEIMRGERDQLRAAAIVSHVRLKSQDTAAISVELEHVEGAVMAAVLPYSKRRFSKKLEYGELQGMDSDARIWS